MADGALGHYTHEKNPVACAAGLATIDVIERDGLVDNARTLGAHALDRTHAMMADYTSIGDVRGLGLLMSMERVHGGWSCRVMQVLRDAGLPRSCGGGPTLHGRGLIE